MRLVMDLMGWLAHDSAASRSPAPHGFSALRVRGEAGRSWKSSEPDRTPGAAAPRSDLPPQPSHGAIRASGVIGTPVFSASGERCGRVCDLSIDKRSGRIVYALVAIEGDLGFLQRLCPAPWPLLRYDAARGGYVAPAERADLAAGPAVTAEELRHIGAGEGAWQERLAIYYNPYLTLPFV